ncbi:MAG: aspartate--tRNA ligase, partial [Pseudomonadota bacterium]
MNQNTTHQYRTHKCGELNLEQVDQIVKISGWVHRMRDHGNLLFIDLRDQYGITQCVIDVDAQLFETATNIKYESVVTITGKVIAREQEAINNEIATGAIEVQIQDLIIESAAASLPLQVNSNQQFPEHTRLKYRFLDLRREKMQKNILLRSQIIASIREKMTKSGFVEFQTPILTSSSPEGARDYLVPSRVHPGKFYALPQAPQQFKQLLMVSGFDKYFQIAPCFRDEDARADRSPGEFYQLDIEMSFVTQEDVFAAIEPIIYQIFSEFSDKKVSSIPFPIISYHDAMLQYGTDKPDLRNEIKISDATEIFVGSGFSIFTKSIEQGKIIRAIPAPNTAEKPRSFFDKMIGFAQDNGAKG